MNWTKYKTFAIGSFKTNSNLLSSNTIKHVAAFDLDDTIIKRKLRTDQPEIYDPIIITKISDLYKSDYHIVIITNQNGLFNKSKQMQKLWYNKIDNLANILDTPLVILVSAKEDCYRKPNTKLWTDNINYWSDQSFYCGDAGGLPATIINGIAIKADFNNTDLKFALNLGIKFKHRNEFIYDQSYTWDKSIVNYPINFNEMIFGSYPTFVPNKPEVIIMIGYPGSGKSYYAKNLISPYKYKYVSMDVMKSKQKCLANLTKYLENQESLIIDNTNNTKAMRKEYLDIIKKYSDFKCRAIWMKTDKELSIHNNFFRNCVTIGQNKVIPMVVYHKYAKYFEEPTLNEGFYDILKIDFRLDKNIDNEKYFKYYF